MINCFLHLGYPRYLAPVLGTYKILGTLVLLLPGFGVAKERAYAGLFFLLSGANLSLVAWGDPFAHWIVPLTCLLLTVASWQLRPADRRIHS